DYFDFTDLTEITMRVKGKSFENKGSIRILLQTKDIYEMVDSNGVQVGWGYYGFNKKLDSSFTDWQDVTIPVLLLDPEQYSPAADSLWTWVPDSLHPEGGCKNVKGFAIQTIPDEDTLTNDSVELWVDDIIFKGLGYKKTFGFDFDSNAIIYFPENNLKMNINAFPNRYTRAINISYDLVKSSDVNIAIFDTRGKRIAELINARQNRGHHVIISDFNTKEMSSGVYFITFRIDEFTATRKFSFIK
ncbi:unnamed protein product, partial [marine sediment metagenome]